MLEEFFGKKLNMQLNPEEAVAQGAAIQAATLAGAQATFGFEQEEEKLQDVTPFHVGIRVCGLDHTNREDDKIDVIIPKNTPYPCEVSI